MRIIHLFPTDLNEQPISNYKNVVQKVKHILNSTQSTEDNSSERTCHNCYLAFLLDPHRIPLEELTYFMNDTCYCYQDMKK